MSPSNLTSSDFGDTVGSAATSVMALSRSTGLSSSEPATLPSTLTPPARQTYANRRSAAITTAELLLINV